jgi:Uma2 family endonuclease
MAQAPEALDQRLFTVEEYHRMAEAGILSPDERVELIRGVILPMSPKRRPHVVAVTDALKILSRALEGRASVYPEAPLVLEDLASEPEPDVLVCSNPDSRAYGTEETAPLLVVEVADSSRPRDLGAKVSLYAEAGIPEYWVVDLARRCLVVFRDPQAAVYRSQSTLQPGERVSPLSWPDVVIDVGSLLPDLPSP